MLGMRGGGIVQMLEVRMHPSIASFSRPPLPLGLESEASGTRLLPRPFARRKHPGVTGASLARRVPRKAQGLARACFRRRSDSFPGVG